jgi:hypothetical protein
MKKSILYFTAFIFLNSCGINDNSPICTGEFRYINIQVLTQNQEPAQLNELSVIDKNTDREIDLCHSDMCGNQGFIGNTESGLYTIMHDHFAGEIDGELELSVSGSGDEGSFSETFVIVDDGCHVSKISGPDQVVLSP